MKHLRNFNEGKSNNFLEELKNFSNNNLAFLLDKGFKVDIEHNPFRNISEIYIFTGNFIVFNWEDVKYDIIPFLIELDRKYNMVPPTNAWDHFFNPDKKMIYMFKSNLDSINSKWYYDVDEIRYDMVELPEKIEQILINIKE